MLHAARSGAGPRVVLLHGFTQTVSSWRPLLPHLDGHETVRVDLPGHGRSSEARLDLAATAAELATTWGPAAWVGYSMGGRVALRLALDHPEAVERLVLVGATAGLDDPAARAERRAADEALAVALERDGVEAFVDRWLAGPLFGSLPAERADRAGRLANTAAGLASSLRLAGTGTMDPPWWDELDRLRAEAVPVTVVVGELDERFAALGRRIVSAVGPTAEMVVVPRAGHACHLEQPDLVGALLAERLGPARA